MSLIFISGISGSGKSAVLAELKSRSLDAHGTDEDGIAGFFDRTTDEQLMNPPATAEERTPEWREKYIWKMSPHKVKELADNAKGRDVFLCGVAENEGEVWNYFDKVIALVVDEDTLKHRILNRTNNNFGKVPHELKSILEWQKSTNDLYKKHGHITIDATQPIKKVVDDILRIL